MPSRPPDLAPDASRQTNTNPSISNRTTVIQPFLERALEAHNSSHNSDDSISLFNFIDFTEDDSESTGSAGFTWPQLHPTNKNYILLFPGSFNPPHEGHRATIEYFWKRRESLGIVAMFICPDADDMLESKSEKYEDVIIPLEIRSKMFARVPDLSLMGTTGWLHILNGDGKRQVEVLRRMTTLIRQERFEVQLVGFLGGDKLSKFTPPHKAVDVQRTWPSVDSLLLINALRPVDFYDPDKDDKPAPLPGCSPWVEGKCGPMENDKDSPGKVWECKALSVPGIPIIMFCASETTPNEISSTAIRHLIAAAPNGLLHEPLKNEEVLSVGILVH